MSHENQTERHAPTATVPQQERSPLHDALLFIALLITHKRLIMLGVSVAVVVTTVVVFIFMPNWYAATANIVPPRRPGSVLDNLTGSISSTLKDFGLTKLAGGKVEGYTPLVIFQSRRMQDTLIQLFQLAELYDIAPHKMTDIRKELAENLVIAVENEGNYTVTAWHTDPQKAAQMANAVVELGNKFSTEIYQAESRVSRILLERRFKQDDINLTKARDTLLNYSRRYKLYSPLDQAKAAASALAELRVQQYKQELTTEMMSTIYGTNDPATQAQRKLLGEINKQSREAQSQPGLAGDFALNVGSDVALEYMRLFTEVEVYTKIKALLVPMMEQAIQDEGRVQPAMYVLDPAIPPDKKDRPKRSLVIAGSALGAFMIMCCFIVLRDRFLALRETYRAVTASLKSDNT